MSDLIWNPWHGCRKLSEGCEHCYMYYLDRTRDRDGREIYKVKTNFNLPLKKDRTGNYKIPSGSDLMVCLTSDFFLEEADPWREEVWEMIRKRPDLRFSFITKRAHRIAACLPADWGEGWENISLTVTAENQKRTEERLPILLSLPIRHKKIIVAPMLGPVVLAGYLESGQIEQVWVDGENYDGTRPCHYEWVRALYEECVRFRVPFDFAGTGNVFVKDGRTYHICKAYQRIQAMRSGLHFPPLAEIPPMQKRCRTCKRRNSCGGCRQCGKCPVGTKRS